MRTLAASVWFALVLVALPHVAPVATLPTRAASVPTTQADRVDLYDLGPADGRLALTPRHAGSVNLGNGRYYTSADGATQYDDYHPIGYFAGRVCVRSEAGRLELGGWREMYRDWEVIRFTLAQTPERATAEYTIRTPVGQPDVTISLDEPTVAHLLIRHPEAAPMLEVVLTALGGWYEPGDVVSAQADPSRWFEPPGLASAVAGLLPVLNSTDWHKRERAESRLAAMGPQVAVYLMLGMDRSELSAQQNTAIDRVTGRHPRLTARDRGACRRDPSLLRTLGRGNPQTQRSE